MKLLAWDTSSKTGALAALEWDPTFAESDWTKVKLVSEFTLNVDSTHSEQLLWGIHQTLQAARWQLKDIDVFGVGLGPGSFTGLRIGITTARTLAHTMGKPVVGVSSLAALARPIALHFSEQKRNPPLVIAATDACKGELFALWGNADRVAKSVVQSEFGNLWSLGVQERVLEPETLMPVLLKKLKLRGSKSQWVVVGEGRQRYLEMWSQLPRSREIPHPLPFSNWVQGRQIGILAWQGFQAGLARKALEIYPHYLRASDAELKLRAGLLGQKRKTSIV